MTGHWHPGTMPDPIALDSGDVRIVKHFRANGNLPKPGRSPPRVWMIWKRWLRPTSALWDSEANRLQIAPGCCRTSVSVSTRCVETVPAVRPSEISEHHADARTDDTSGLIARATS